MVDTLPIKPIGIIHTPYKECDDIPIQGRFRPDTEGWLELDEEYVGGLADLNGFTHAILLYYFHCSERTNVAARPFLEDAVHGIFAIRSPHRPNHIGLSVVRIENIANQRVYFTNVDVLDGTPLLDIKPYITHFDCFSNAVCGWIDKHFADGKTPVKAVKPHRML